MNKAFSSRLLQESVHLPTMDRFLTKLVGNLEENKLIGNLA